jgi:hypothetical protein
VKEIVDLEDLKSRIEELRLYMVKLAMEKGKFSDPAVVKISQQLDKLIIHYQAQVQSIYLRKRNLKTPDLIISSQHSLRPRGRNKQTAIK